MLRLKKLRATPRKHYAPGSCIREFMQLLGELADPDQLVRARESFLCLLDASPELEGEKIDVVLHSPLHEELRPIDRVARAEGVRL